MTTLPSPPSTVAPWSPREASAGPPWHRRARQESWAALVIVLAGCSKEPAPAPARTPAEVGVFVVEAQRQSITTELPGRTAARVVAEIRPQVGGIVQRRLFEEGTNVRAGQVLYQLDPASFEAAHASARAGVAKAEATVNSAAVTARRNTELVKIDAISQQLNDDSQAALMQARADLGVARAALDTARINLERTRITSPIAGRVETSSVTAGALVTANQETALTTVQQLDPLYVDVTQSSTELLRLKRDLASGALQRSSPERAASAASPAGNRNPVQPGAPRADETPIRLLLEDGSAYRHPGVLKVSGATVNPGTGAITLRALVPNPDGLLIPGMYVRAVLEQGVVEEALLVPQRGITRTPAGAATAMVVTAQNKVERRTIVVDRAIGSRWQVTQGLQVGDQVVVEGLQRIKVGDTVKTLVVAPAALPGDEAASAPSPSPSPAGLPGGPAAARASGSGAATAPATGAPLPALARR